jgi:hypothetical protein
MGASNPLTADESSEILMNHRRFFMRASIPRTADESSDIFIGASNPLTADESLEILDGCIKFADG